MSDGMAIEQSELTTAVAGSLAWSKGDFHLLGSDGTLSHDTLSDEPSNQSSDGSSDGSSGGERVRSRRLAQARAHRLLGVASDTSGWAWREQPRELKKLLSTLVSFFIALCVLLGVQITGTCCWKYR